MTWRHQTPWTMDLGQSTDKYVLISCSHYLPTFSTQSSSFPSHHLNLAHKQCRAWVLLQIHTARHSTLQREYLLKHLQNIYSVEYLLYRISTLQSIEKACGWSQQSCDCKPHLHVSSSGPGLVLGEAARCPQSAGGRAAAAEDKSHYLPPLPLCHN